MVRLVTQFDEPSARPSVATPTCAGCCSCCCCCCVATTIATTTYTTLDVRKTAADAGVDVDRANLAEFFGCFSFMALLPGAVGALAVIVMVFSDVDMDWRFVPTALLWPAALYGLYRYAGDRQPARTAGCVWFAGMILFVIELVLGGIALLASPWLYVICMPLAAIAGVWGARRLTNA
jgi:hypothetical protein